MNRSIQSLLGMVVLVAAFSLFLASALSYLLGPELLSSDEIVLQAEQSVPPLALPPAPNGRLVTETINEEVVTKVPRVTGFPPRITFDETKTIVPKTVQRLEAPTTEEMTQWNETMERLQGERKREVDKESARISREQSAELRSLLKDIVQMIASLAGLVFGAVNLWLGIRKEARELAPSVSAATQRVSDLRAPKAKRIKS